MKTEINPITGGANMARRSFLRYAGASAAAVAVMGAASCTKNDNPLSWIRARGIDIGSGDIRYIELCLRA
jgi:poly(3-hydroxybutyrate) depolymerase